MVQMIKAGKEGLYIFHRGEECGCLGSGWLAANTPEVLKDIDIAIAFDRFGTKHVITHQAHGRCCSDDFAFALARQLGNEYHPDDTGVYTDTNEYISLVSECTNIAVGYYNQHSDLETQNIPHLSKLLPALLALDPTALPVVRDPSEYDGYYEASLYLDGLSSMEQLVRDNPDAVAELLRDYGIDSAGLIDEIFRLSGKVTW
ncbi:hypothetical protein [uncultured Cohaesibacter sp.]|uniref:hypothetical protein n=1 Tax=uncultured Cohaesibacter sp. TaxID=1002546 RepID=UPI0029C6CE47|nr:hypothetical protein [uncultured Cohaesibacter sp.]